MDTSTVPKIIDIRQDGGGLTPLVPQIREGLNAREGQEKKLPTLLLYSEDGLKLFEKITYLEEYYPTGQEIQVLEACADRIADRIALESNSMLVELGSGNLRKVRILLDALDRKGKDVSYYALDVSEVELEHWLKKPENAHRSKTVLSLGSSIGNFSRDEAAKFLSQFSETLDPNDTLLLGVDACTDADKVYHAYNDREGLTHEFILCGLKQANRLLGYDAFDTKMWEVIGRYNKKTDRHEAFVSPKEDVTIEGALIRAGEQVRIEESYKYNPVQSERLWSDAGLTEGAKWTNTDGDYALHLLNKPKVQYPLVAEKYAAHPVPSLEEWDQLWAAWDAVTLEMIPEEDLLEKPIKLRNACIFYLGHIPTFMDIHLTRATHGKPTEPSSYTNIFERGIDPDVDDPEQCHAHSEIPDSWPPATEILDFQSKVRIRVKKLYASGQAVKDRAVSRAMWLSYEHEIMHLETLLYMLIQSEKTMAPPTTVMPDFEALANQARQGAVENQWFDIPEQKVEIGIEDPDDNSGPEHFFGWDNEKPKRTVHVPAFKAKGRPITNGEFAKYLEENHLDTLPASWHTLSHTQGTETNGHTSGISSSFLQGKAVRTVYGPISLKLALDWPVCASYDELRGCARWMGGRIPSMEEARSIYRHVDEAKTLQAHESLGANIPAVNAHLVNDGVEESPPSKALSSSSTGPNPNELFVDLLGANVGFRHWHPVPVSQHGNKLAGQSEMGGVWEWTSSVLEKQEGFEAMPLYPGYAADFFDGKHNIVLGGSWATHPRIAGRKSFVNWYQRNYPFVWAGARIVKDAIPFELDKMIKELLRWEDSPGLEHHCPKCQTPLNNPRAKHTCYFKHVEICPLFHQHFFMIGQSLFSLLALTLSYIFLTSKIFHEQLSAMEKCKANLLLTGQAHNCDTCRRNNSAHDQRHRQIAMLLRQLTQLQQENGIEPGNCPTSPFSPAFSPTGKRGSVSWPADTDPETTPKLKKRERKKAKKRIKALKGGDALTTAEVAAIATALHPCTRNDSVISTSSTSTFTTEPSNQSTVSEDSATTTPTPTSPTSPISENPSFTTLMNVNKSFHPDVDGKLNSTRMALQTQLLSVLHENSLPLDASVENALCALGISESDHKTPKPVAECVAKVKEAIREDIFCAECDEKKFRLREAAWYRFVNRSVLALREGE
ncbi:hypothetical protein E4T43_06782 [Aureobasidium subglaciale]|nr:hypothetical protein E4T43_06782 [Aureobasidium subglaciale]